jgi:PIN domain nuclease of toxin-antitoxin system
MIVLDTSALIYWTAYPEGLSQAAARGIEEADQIVVSSISIWEIERKVQQGRLDLFIPISEYVERLAQLERLDIRPVDVQNWLDNLALAWDHKDPADRTIVALAARLECPLVTSDQKILEFYSRTVW